MATYIQLDQAARQVGKSEITVRRLIKSGKISHKKEKTLTGFIYLVDPEEIGAFYDGSKPPVAAKKSEVPPTTPEPESSEEEIPSRQVRVAVTGASGDLGEYWRKRAEAFEDRYQHAVEKQAHLREELGIWRGRAEQAQTMLATLLPAQTEQAPTSQVTKKESQSEPASGKMPAWLLVLLGAVIVGELALLGLAVLRGS